MVSYVRMTKCSQCPFESTSELKFQIHNASAHLFFFQCKFCDKSFDSRYLVARHLLFVHFAVKEQDLIGTWLEDKETHDVYRSVKCLKNPIVISDGPRRVPSPKTSSNGFVSKSTESFDNEALVEGSEDTMSSRISKSWNNPIMGNESADKSSNTTSYSGSESSYQTEIMGSVMTNLVDLISSDGIGTMTVQAKDSTNELVEPECVSESKSHAEKKAEMIESVPQQSCPNDILNDYGTSSTSTAYSNNKKTVGSLTPYKNSVICIDIDEHLTSSCHGEEEPAIISNEVAECKDHLSPCLPPAKKTRIHILESNEGHDAVLFRSEHSISNQLKVDQDNLVNSSQDIDVEREVDVSPQETKNGMFICPFVIHQKRKQV